MHCLTWCSALVVMAVVVWSWDASCVHCEGYCSNSTTFMMHGHKSLDLYIIISSLREEGQTSCNVTTTQLDSHT